MPMEAASCRDRHSRINDWSLCCPPQPAFVQITRPPPPPLWIPRRWPKIDQAMSDFPYDRKFLGSSTHYYTVSDHASGQTSNVAKVRSECRWPDFDAAGPSITLGGGAEDGGGDLQHSGRFSGTVSDGRNPAQKFLLFLSSSFGGGLWDGEVTPECQCHGTFSLGPPHRLLRPPPREEEYGDVFGALTAQSQCGGFPPRTVVHHALTPIPL